MSVGNIVQSIRKIMRKDAGVDGDAQRISEMTWMIFLKVFDAMEQENEAEDLEYKSCLPEKIKWRNWAEDEEGLTGEDLYDFINNEVFVKLKELDTTNNKKASIVRQVFEETNTYMKNGVLMRQVINEINKIDFTSSKDRHLFNDIYETILKELQSAGSSGEFYTPRPVTNFIVDRISPKLGEIVLDPACGTGGFLVSTVEKIKKDIKNIEDIEILQKNIMGIEKKSLPHLLGMTNLILHDLETPNIRHDNSLSKPIRDIGANEMVDCIITNPPFGGAEEDDIENNFPSNFRTRETADLFLVLIMKMLRDEGRCGIVLPSSPVDEGKVKGRIIEELLSKFNLHTIIRLPNGVFSPYTDIDTNLLFFEKGKPTKEIWYFFHPIREDLSHLKHPKYSKTKPIQDKEFDLAKEWWNNREDKKFEKYCVKVDIEKIEKRKFDLWIKNPNDVEELEQMSSKEIVELLEKNLEKTKDLLKKIKGDV